VPRTISYLKVESNPNVTPPLSRLGRLCHGSQDQMQRRVERVLTVIVYTSVCLCGCASVLQGMLDDLTDSPEYSSADRAACRKKCRTEEGPDYEKFYKACMKQRDLALRETREQRAEARKELRHEDEIQCDSLCRQKEDSERQKCLRDCSWQRASSFSAQQQSRISEKRAKQRDEEDRARIHEKIDRSLGR
jgi:hypothetical protein